MGIISNTITIIIVTTSLTLLTHLNKHATFFTFIPFFFLFVYLFYFLFGFFFFLQGVLLWYELRCSQKTNRKNSIYLDGFIKHTRPLNHQTSKVKKYII
jgi:hypothetical protein